VDRILSHYVDQQTVVTALVKRIRAGEKQRKAR
jgi:hypothetical protein